MLLYTVALYSALFTSFLHAVVLQVVMPLGVVNERVLCLKELGPLILLILDVSWRACIDFSRGKFELSSKSSYSLALRPRIQFC